jgi:2-keto-3-deoxy-L-rhamnonate aldolase RhmA
VDVLFLGLFDLCLGLGLDPLALPHPQVDEIIARTLEIGEARGVAIGIGVRDADELAVQRARGFRFLSFGTDYFLLLDSARRGVEAFRPPPDD